MSDPTNENDINIDALLRDLGYAASIGHLPWRHAALVALVAERDALKKRVAELVSNADELAAIREQRDEALVWRPIETAPRGSGLDGPDRRDAVGYVDPPALLLASRDGVVEVGAYDWYYHPGYGNGGSLGESPWRDHYEGREIPKVTHWMPLPQPPREKEGGGA